MRSVASASEKRARCCVTSTNATAKSRVAPRIERPSVHTRMTSPVVAAPFCHSTSAQPRSAIVKDRVTAVVTFLAKDV